MFNFCNLFTSPQALAKKLKSATHELSSPDECKSSKAKADISKQLLTLKNKICGPSNSKPSVRQQNMQLIQAFIGSNLFLMLVQNLCSMDFESKKLMTLIFNQLLKLQTGATFPLVEHIRTQPEIVFTLMNGYESRDAIVAINSGSMLRACIQHRSLSDIIFCSTQFYNFFRYIDLKSFDIASDAFYTFKQLLVSHKVSTAEFLKKNYHEFFKKHYQHMLRSTNYVTKRESLRLLVELLLDRANYAVMLLFIAESDNLKLIMNLLADKSPNIQLEAFHIFKLFAAKPKKEPAVQQILLRNKLKLLKFLTQFDPSPVRNEDFEEDKQATLKAIKGLKPLPEISNKIESKLK